MSDPTQKTYRFRRLCQEAMQPQQEEYAVREKLVGAVELTPETALEAVEKAWDWAGVDAQAMPSVRRRGFINGYAAYSPVPRWGAPPNTIVYRGPGIPVRALLHEACHAILWHTASQTGHTRYFRTMELACYDALLPGFEVDWDTAERTAEELGLSWASLNQLPLLQNQ